MGEDSNAQNQALLDAAMELVVLILEVPSSDLARLPEAIRKLLGSKDTPVLTS